MKLSTRCRYGIRAMIEIARNYNKRPTKRKEISASQGLDGSYLENILIDLKKMNLVMATRGAKGGFFLRRAPEEITMLDVVESLHGDLSPSECLTTPAVCDRVGGCATRPIWQKVKEAQEEVLRKVTIKSLLDEEEQERAL